MKQPILLAICLCITASVSVPAQADNACKVVICLFGKMTETSGGAGCHSAEKQFFSLNAFKKREHFNPAKTFALRQAFLGECIDADPETVSQVLNQFGRIRG
ncbi:conjugal transfer protein [Candidatus Regiella endosymbiont of Tuberolachnus salignus]|uniref:conjugal transfer protein n=1 Tax=Candidatus Regiella endosymbiont of Tuberolachnus salignus TaxID=3077956 RepID=UPI0030D3FC80